MKRSVIYILAAMLAIGGAAQMQAQAQDLKPVKDKGTKLFGYQDKNKNWVIPPSFEGAKKFKDGLAEVTLKPEKTKFHGVIDESGKVIIPIDCHNINIYYKDNIITAQRASQDNGLAWGVYNYDGKEIWAPQFVYSPTFYGKQGIARSAQTGLLGVIDLDGQVLIPFDNLALERAYGGFVVLTDQFVRKSYDNRINKTSEFSYPGYVAPYDPEGDPVRAAAWHVGPIGYRFHRNNLRYVQILPSGRGMSATCSELRIDWGIDRFVRFEPVPDPDEHPCSMEDPVSGNIYTVKAVLCEADGTPVGDISSWGWIDTEYAEGVTYNAEGNETWMIMRDINCPALSSFTTPLSRAKTFNHDDVISGLGITSYELQRMYEPVRYSERALAILKGENCGITYKLPPVAMDLRMARTINDIHRMPIFRHHFEAGDIVNCKTRMKDGTLELELSDGFVCEYEDRFEDPDFRMEGEEVLYWGPYNDYTVQLSAELLDKGILGTKDDLYGTDASFGIVLNLYDGRGNFLQTIARAPVADYYADNWLVFEKLGIALHIRERRYGDRRSDDRRYDDRRYDDQRGDRRYDDRRDDRRSDDRRYDDWKTDSTRPGSPRKLTIPGAERIAPNLSALEALGKKPASTSHPDGKSR
jgi:hypothetical protein